MDRADIADYLNSNVVDQISRVEGVGNVNVFGSAYGPHLAGPAKLRTYGLSAGILPQFKHKMRRNFGGAIGKTPPMMPAKPLIIQ